jgi:RNA polymerase sigma factor (sigma-70 family)
VRSSDQRDEDWFTSLYAAYYPAIVRYGVRRLANLDAAAELAQEVFVVAWRRRRHVPDRALPWLYGVARRVLANEWRARRSRPTEVPLGPSELVGQAGPPDAVAAVADVRAALAGLSEGDQEILRLVGWEQLTVAEAAVVLDCGRATAAVRLHRARRRLRAALEPANPPHPAAAGTLERNRV